MEDYAIVSYYENHMTWCHECIKIHSKGKQTKTKQRTSEQEKTVALFWLLSFFTSRSLACVADSINSIELKK